MKKNIEKLVASLPKDEQVALGLGFHNASAESFYYPDHQSEGRTSVNGEWQSFDDIEDAEDSDFDNFLTKKRRELRESGLSRKDARKDALADIPRDKLKDVAKDVAKKAIGGLKKAGSLIMKASMVAPRGSALALIQVNFRGFAEKLNYVMGNNPTKWKEVSAKWKKWGGKVEKLEKAVNKGKKKKPLFCGKKCKSKLIYKVVDSKGKVDKQKLNAIIAESQEYNNAAVTTTTAALVTLGGGVITALGSIIGKSMETKQLKEAKALDMEMEQKELDLMTKTQKDQLALAEKQIEAELSPKTQIMTNSNLSPAEKKEAVAELDKSLEIKGSLDMKKLLIYGGIGVVLLGVFLMVSKRS